MRTAHSHQFKSLSDHVSIGHITNKYGIVLNECDDFFGVRILPSKRRSGSCLFSCLCSNIYSALPLYEDFSRSIYVWTRSRILSSFIHRRLFVYIYASLLTVCPVRSDCIKTFLSFLLTIMKTLSELLHTDHHHQTLFLSLFGLRNSFLGWELIIDPTWISYFLPASYHIFCTQLLKGRFIQAEKFVELRWTLFCYENLPREGSIGYILFVQKAVAKHWRKGGGCHCGHR